MSEEERRRRARQSDLSDLLAETRPVRTTTGVRASSDLSDLLVDSSPEPSRIGLDSAFGTASRLLNETLPGRALKGTVQVAGSMLDALDYPLGMPARAITGAIGGAMDSKPIIQSAIDSALRKEGKTYRSSDLLEKAGAEPVAAALGGIPLDMLAGAYPWKVIGGIGKLTGAGRAAESLPMYAATKAATPANAARNLEETGGEVVNRVLSNIFGASRKISPSRKVALLDEQAAKIRASGGTVGADFKELALKPTIGEQGYAGQRSIFQLPLPGGRELKVPNRVSGAVLTAAGKAGGNIAEVARKAPVTGTAYRWLVDESGHPGSQDMVRKAQFLEDERRGEYLGRNLKELQEKATKAKLTPDELKEVYRYAERPLVEQRMLAPLNQDGHKILNGIPDAKKDNIYWSFNKLVDDSRRVEAALATAPPTSKAAAVLQAKLNVIQGKLSIMEESPMSAKLLGAREHLMEQINPASWVLTPAEAARKKQMTRAVQEIDALQAKRQPLIDSIKAGGTAAPASRAEIKDLASDFRKLMDKSLADETALGVHTPRLWGRDVEYMPHMSTQELRTHGGLKSEPIGLGGILQNPEHTSQLHRDFAGMSAEEINQLANQRKILQYHGIDLSKYGGPVVSEDPFYAANLRLLKGAKSQAGARYLDEVVKAHDPSGVWLMDEFRRGGGVPDDTLKKVFMVKLPKEQAVHVAEQLKSMGLQRTDFESLGGLHDLNNIWKAGALAKPGTAVRNILGNTIMAQQVADVDRLRPYLDARKLYKASPEELRKLKFWSRAHGREISGDEALRMAGENGAFGTNIQYGAQEFGPVGHQKVLVGSENYPLVLNPTDRAGAPYKALEGLREKLGAGPVDAAASVLDTARQIPFIGDKGFNVRATKALSNAGEQQAKLAVFLDRMLYQGQSPESAGKAALDALIDYGKHTAAQNKYGKLIMPFINWELGNLKNQARTLIRNPGKFASQNAVLGGLAGLYPEVTPAQATDAVGKGETHAPFPGPYTEGIGLDKQPETQRKMYALDQYIPGPNAAAWLVDPAHKFSDASNAIGKLAYGATHNWDSFRHKPIDKMREVVERPGMQALKEYLSPENTSFMGMETTPTKKGIISGVFPQLADLNRMNPANIFGTQGQPAFGGAGAVRFDKDLPGLDRAARYFGGAPSYAVDTVLDQLGYRAGVKLLKSNLRQTLRQLTAQLGEAGAAEYVKKREAELDQIVADRVLERMREPAPSNQ